MGAPLRVPGRDLADIRSAQGARRHWAGTRGSRAPALARLECQAAQDAGPRQCASARLPLGTGRKTDPLAASSLGRALPARRVEGKGTGGSWGSGGDEGEPGWRESWGWWLWAGGPASTQLRPRGQRQLQMRLLERLGLHLRRMLSQGGNRHEQKFLAVASLVLRATALQTPRGGERGRSQLRGLGGVGARDWSQPV